MQEQFTPRIVRNLLLEAPLVGDAILGNQSTLRIRSDSWSKAEADSRFLRTNDLGPLDARYFPNTPGAEGGGIFSLVQTQFTPVVIWSKGESDGRYPLIANFNSLGQRVTDLENAPGVDPTAELRVNSLAATSFVDTPLLQSAAADLQIRTATTTIRPKDGTLLASFATGSIGLEQDITVRAGPDPQRHHGGFRPVLRRQPPVPLRAAAPSRPRNRSRATCGCRRRWCAATRRHHC